MLTCITSPRKCLPCCFWTEHYIGGSGKGNICLRIGILCLSPAVIIINDQLALYWGVVSCGGLGRVHTKTHCFTLPMSVLMFCRMIFVFSGLFCLFVPQLNLDGRGFFPPIIYQLEVAITAIFIAYFNFPSSSPVLATILMFDLLRVMVCPHLYQKGICK